MITSMHIENFKCFKDFDIDLGPFNVLVGPNDSGKTSLLQAIRVASVLRTEMKTQDREIHDRSGVRVGPETLYQGERVEDRIRISVRHRPAGASGDNVFEAVADCYTQPPGNVRNVWEARAEAAERGATLGEVSFWRLDPKALRVPTPLVEKLAPDGAGLPGLVARMAIRRDGSVDALERDFRQRFPFYTAIIAAPSQRGDVAHLRFRTSQGGELPCTHVSDGVMLSLAFMAIRHAMRSPEILLIEQPEDGVHYGALKDTVDTLAHLSENEQAQVILTTHSPYLLDCVEPEQVHVFSKNEEGAVQAGRLAEHPEVDSLRRIFGTGEIWTGFESERDIVTKTGHFE